MATSYNGWTASKDPASIGVDSGFVAAGRKFPGGVKSGDVSILFKYLVEQFDARVEEVDLYAAGDEWGYHYKQSANSPSLLSCHSSGTAVDVNATRHPNGKRGTFSDAQVTAIRQILAECSGAVRWLGDAPRVPDEMHFEIFGDASKVKAAADKIRAGNVPAHEAPEDYMADHHGMARILMRTYLGRNPSNQQELDEHAWALAVHGLNARAQQLADSTEGKAYEAQINNERAKPDQ